MKLHVLGWFAALCFVFASAIPVGVAADQALSAGSRAPVFTLPVIANGSGTFDLNKQRGHGVYVNFFASWCEPCKLEASAIEKAAREVAPGTVVIGIAVLDTQLDARAFAREHVLTYPIAFDETGKVGAAYQLDQLPLHVFVGPDGLIKQYVAGGPISEGELHAGLRAIAH